MKLLKEKLYGFIGKYKGLADKEELKKLNLDWNSKGYSENMLLTLICKIILKGFVRKMLKERLYGFIGKQIVLTYKEDLRNLVLVWNLKGYSEDKINKLIKGYDYSSITDFSDLFRFCCFLETIPELDTSNVTNMNCAFLGCESLKTIPKLDTSKVTNMDFTFYGCSSLETIPKLDTSNVTDMYATFYKCESLKKIYITATGKKTLDLYLKADDEKRQVILKMIGVNDLFDNSIKGLSDIKDKLSIA